MIEAFRVFPFSARAAVGTPGHPMYVSSVQGAGRIDNPESYRTLYVSDHAAGAVAERLGNLATWGTDVIASLTRDGMALSLATLEVEQGALLDLDAAAALTEHSLRPSDVATRDRISTQNWALLLFQQQRWEGLRWWGRFEARWGAIGLWDLRHVRVKNVEDLNVGHPAYVHAATALGRM